MINSKKAIGVDDLFPLLFTVVVFIFIIMLFTYSHSKEKEAINLDVQKIMKEVEGYNLLHTFLSQKISFDLNLGHSNMPGEIQELDMADFIKYYYIEEDPLNKDAYYSRIQNNLENMFDPLEYCYINPYGVKLKSTYFIFITEDLGESHSEWEEKVKDRTFKSQSADVGLYHNWVIRAIPLLDSKILYIKFFMGWIIAPKTCPVKK